LIEPDDRVDFVDIK